MAQTPRLVKCRSCAAQISERAKICPRCGAPNKRGTRWEMQVGIVVGVMFVLVSLAMDGLAGDVLFWVGVAILAFGIIGRLATH